MGTLRPRHDVTARTKDRAAESQAVCNVQGEPPKQVGGPEKLIHPGVLIGEAASLSIAPNTTNPRAALDGNRQQ